MAKGSPTNPYAVGAPTPYGGAAKTDPMGGTTAAPVQQQQAAAAAPAQPTWGAQPAAAPRAPASRDGLATTMANAPAAAPVAAPRAQTTGYMAPAATAYTPSTAAAATPAAAPAAAAPAAVAPKAAAAPAAAAPKAVTPAATPAAAAPAVAAPKAATPAAAPVVNTPAGPVVKPYVAPKAVAKAPVVAKAGPSAPKTVNASGAWTSAQTKAGGRWEDAKGPYSLGRQWVTAPAAAPKAQKTEAQTAAPVAAAAPATTGTGLHLVSTNSGNGGLYGNGLPDIFGAAQAGRTPIGGTQGINGSTGPSPLVVQAVNTALPHITAAQWDSLKGKTWEQLSKSNDPIEQAIASNMTNIVKKQNKSAQQNWQRNNGGGGSSHGDRQ